LTENLEQFWDNLNVSLTNKEFIKLTLSKPRAKGELQNIYVRPILLKDQKYLSCTFRYKTKDETRNYSFDEGIAFLKQQIPDFFLHANLFTSNQDITLESSKKGNIRFSSQAATLLGLSSLAHDQPKKRFITPDRPYLQALGITNKQGQILKEGQAKYKQIDKYIEIMDSLLSKKQLVEPIHIADMGSGKGYLTFALYDYLTYKLGWEVNMVGIELRPNLVDFCNELAQKMAFTNLSFIAQDIKDYPTQKIDVLIALHACDTATDIAIAKGIQSNAQFIVCAPCCHKQVRKQMNKHNNFQSILKHGILEERQAELITDGIRALIMEYYGYNTKVFEFISNEHTGKNLMITGVSNNHPNKDTLEQIATIKRQFGIQYHYLEQLLF
jgi:SAM-dependent methyltransferase